MSDAGIGELLWPNSLSCHDLTLSTTEDNLALDEALLAEVESNPTAACLRFWQPAKYSIVLGRSNKVESETLVDQCDSAGIPILRRASGGGAVLIGPGCLCYSLVLPIGDRHRSLGVSKMTHELMSRTAAGLSVALSDVQVCGTSDLTWNGLKFSGNAQRWLRRSFIHHGTILFDFDLSLMERFLRHPTREPSYRQSRRHAEFVGNLAITAIELRSGLMAVWNAVSAECPTAVLDDARRIAASRYRTADWKISPRS